MHLNKDLVSGAGLYYERHSNISYLFYSDTSRGALASPNVSVSDVIPGEGEKADIGCHLPEYGHRLNTVTSDGSFEAL